MFHHWQKQPPKVVYKKGAAKNFAEQTGKYLCWNLSFNKVSGLRPATLLKKRLWHRCFLVNFAKFLRNIDFVEHLQMAVSVLVMCRDGLSKVIPWICNSDLWGSKLMKKKFQTKLLSFIFTSTNLKKLFNSKFNSLHDRLVKFGSQKTII